MVRSRQSTQLTRNTPPCKFTQIVKRRKKTETKGKEEGKGPRREKLRRKPREQRAAKGKKREKSYGGGKGAVHRAVATCFLPAPAALYVEAYECQ